MATEMTGCVHCGSPAIATNKAGQPACNDHRNDTKHTETCPMCGSDMELRSGSHGKFWGCKEYPDCRGTKDIGD